MNNKIAIAISTRNRPESFMKVWWRIGLYLPKNCKVFIVDDATDNKYCVSDFTFKERSGISAVKNKCLQLCFESDADHLFLFDDDTYPIADDWWVPYIESGLNHASYCFSPGNEIDYISMNDCKIISGNAKYHKVPNGCMLYFTRKCIETVGGFDTKYNNKYEHTDLSRRIYNAGLIPAPYIDIIGSDKVIYCMDQDNAIERSFTEKEMQDNLRSGYDYFMSQSNSTEFKEFRT